MTYDIIDPQVIHTCYFCLEDDLQTNMITPCQCSGSIKYVHRVCLNDMRKKSQKQFDGCTICKRSYKLRQILEETNWYFLYYYSKFTMLIIRDTIIVLFITNLIITGAAYLLYKYDESCDFCMGIKNRYENTELDYYIATIFMLPSFIGVFFIVLTIIASALDGHNTQGLDSDAMYILSIVFGSIIIAAFYIMIFHQIIIKHIEYLRLKLKVKNYEVMDLDGLEPLEHQFQQIL